MWLKCGEDRWGIMTDVVVKIDIADQETDAKFIQALDEFALSWTNYEHDGQREAPEIMIKSVPNGQVVRRNVIFQDKQAADEFMSFWARAIATA